MNAIQLLKNEHGRRSGRFGEIQAASADQRTQLWARLEPELKVHKEMEETALYGPVAQEAGSRNQKLKEWQEHHHVEVLEAEALIQEIEVLDPTTDEWVEKVEERAARDTGASHRGRRRRHPPQIEQPWD